MHAHRHRVRQRRRRTQRDSRKEAVLILNAITWIFLPRNTDTAQSTGVSLVKEIVEPCDVSMSRGRKSPH